jgi:hypothetical protein
VTEEQVAIRVSQLFKDKPEAERDREVEYNRARYRAGADALDLSRRDERVAGLKDEIKKGLTEASYLDMQREAGVPERLMESRRQDYRNARKQTFDADPEVAKMAERIKAGLTRETYVADLKAKDLVGFFSKTTAAEKQRLFDLYDEAKLRVDNPAAGSAPGKPGEAIAKPAAGAGSGFFAETAKLVAGIKEAAPAVKGGRAGAGLGDDFGKSMSAVLASLRLSLGPKATVSGLGDVGRAAQLAALNNDPLDAELLRLQLSALERIERGVADLKPKGGPAEKPGLGGGK